MKRVLYLVQLQYIRYLWFMTSIIKAVSWKSTLLYKTLYGIFKFIIYSYPLYIYIYIRRWDIRLNIFERYKIWSFTYIQEHEGLREPSLIVMAHMCTCLSLNLEHSLLLVCSLLCLLQYVLGVLFEASFHQLPLTCFRLEWGI